MLLIEKEFEVLRTNESLIQHFSDSIQDIVSESEIPVRFAVTASDADAHHCEVGILTGAGGVISGQAGTIFAFRKRRYENRSSFNAVMLVPTGIGAEIGGHAGDACPVARLLASVCDTLITHPNVVNASDINEMPTNSLYVEGSVIADLLMGTCGLSPSRANRIILLIDKHRDPRITASTINAVSAARATLGLDCPAVIEVDPPIVMRGRYATSGTAVGRVEGLGRICEVLQKYEGQFDAIALASVIDVPSEYHTEYFHKRGQMVNPWGGVEAILTHAISKLYSLPAAHSPMFESTEIANLDVGIVDPRMSAEAISACFLHCILKGLHSSPQVTRDEAVFQSNGVVTAEDISCVVIPDGCLGLPTLAALEQGIPVVAVRENKNLMKNDLEELPWRVGQFYRVGNYWEAAGIIAALKAGIAPESVRRPLAYTQISTENVREQALESVSISAKTVEPMPAVRLPIGPP